MHCLFSKVSFAAVRGDSPLGDIALDEISINEVKDCKVLNKTASSGNGVVVSNPQEGKCQTDKTNLLFRKIHGHPATSDHRSLHLVAFF